MRNRRRRKLERKNNPKTQTAGRHHGPMDACCYTVVAMIEGSAYIIERRLVLRRG